MFKIRNCLLFLTILSTLVISACSRDTTDPLIPVTNESKQILGSETESSSGAEIETSASTNPTIPLPSVETKDWSEHFQGLTGTAVLYIPSQNKYDIYNEELSEVRRSPCSTFKIISSLAGIENEVINPENSVRKWSEEIFWNENWNRDIGFEDAFRTSCIWYFREVINELGSDVIEAELNKLKYGNCDISDWEGRLNNNNNNRSLTGFWVESSLKISPKEQTEVMERIFSENSLYSKKTRNLLKDVMLVTDPDTSDIKIYGKTGLGKVSGVTVDSWFTGLAETEDDTIYFCVYLGESKGMEPTSTKAKEIAVQILLDYTAGN